MPNPSPRSSSFLWLATVASISVLLLATLVLTKSIQREADSWQWVVHTRAVLERLQIVLTLTSEAEAAQRGFLISGAERQLLIYRQDSEGVTAEIDALKSLTHDNPVQQQAIGKFKELVLQRLGLLHSTLQMKLDGAPFDPELLESGFRVKTAILEQAAKIRAEEQRLLNEREARVLRARTELIVSVAAVFVLSIGLLVFLRLLYEKNAASLLAERAQLREAQRQLQEANQLLEQRIQERTQQIAEANAELQGFAHTVAHDLRAPLRNVEGFASALLEDEADRMSDDGKMFAGRICAAVVRMDRLITDLLAYSRLSRSELRLQRVDTSEVLKAVRRDLESQISETQAQIIVDEPLPAVQANQAVFMQIISNLLANALKFVAQGKLPRVRIHGASVNGMSRISIEDNGIGIDPAHHDHVFGVFERLHGQEQYPGTGIGLAIVKKGVERMGGQIKVQGLPDGGTRFEVFLPSAEKNADEQR
ncbi:His Kinase A (phospho-acceptor) domain-containing protein [Noviherbaspirillum humi]|uniref:histidine kinase n=1 Tax=Noviherbaspirillum humi TaxID=1688639 RepID=A0A239DRN7_9BURK|nr:sensor histidine kinase [Noviherbaspirillum humi]SNS34393.1 His Kinase A (phospho-acceptor) domain-containing protein [Noviherbaspirillum humi]